MDTTIPTPSGEARATRIRWVAEKLAAAQQKIDAGLGISGPDLDTWLNQSMGTDDPVPASSHVSATTRR